MSQLIASDANNPNFTGAHDPDARLAVQFYSKPVQNEFKSKEAARPIFDDVDFVKIFVPGDQYNVVDTYARDDHKQRFPRQWALYQNNKGTATGFAGTPLSAWSFLTPAQAEELKHFKFFTVEHVANAGDLQLQSIGMMAGMSAHQFRERARTFLQVAAQDATAAKDKEEIERLRAENAANAQALQGTNAALESLQRQMAQMMASQGMTPPASTGDSADASTPGRRKDRNTTETAKAA